MAAEERVVMDLVLRVETVGALWQVSTGSVRERVVPLTDADLVRTIEGVTSNSAGPITPADARTWQGFLDYLEPGRGWSPGRTLLEAVGRLLHDHLVRGKVATAVSSRLHVADRSRSPVRLVVHVFEGEEDGLLARLPFELMVRESCFWLRSSNTIGVRLPPESDPCDVQIRRGAKVIVAAAHLDDRAPTRDDLVAHANRVIALLEQSGLVAHAIFDCTPRDLEAALEAGCDVLYVVAHGVEDFEQRGRLSLCGDTVTGTQLGDWIERAYVNSGRRIEAALLCACSSAAAPGRPGTMSMAAHLAAGSRRAKAALGFRAPVDVRWALAFMTTVFDHVGKGEPLETAVARARQRQPDNDSQWILPSLFTFANAQSLATGATVATHLRDAPPIMGGPRLVGSLLPIPPRPYFTARTSQLAALRAWRRAPGTAVLTALAGEGGVGKTEVARKVAHDAHAEGTVVLWIERPDQHIGSSLLTMIRQAVPDFESPAASDLDDLRSIMTRELGPGGGLLVLDDVEAAFAVATLTPGPTWNVLVTTRRRNLLPDVVEIEVHPLDPDDAVEMLAGVAQNGVRFTDADRRGAYDLVEALGRLPLAIELAGELVRRGYDLAVTLAMVAVAGNETVHDRLGRVMDRSLAQLQPGDERAWALVAAMPPAGATESEVAAGLDEPVGRAGRRLFRLRQSNLLRLRVENGRYTMHALARQVAQVRSTAAGTWGDLLARSARVVASVAAWCHAPIGRDSAEAWRRWRSRGRDLLSQLDAAAWPPGSDLATAILYADTFWHGDRTPAERVASFDAVIGHVANRSLAAHLHHARGEVRRFNSDVAGAEYDYTRALALHEAVGDLVGQADSHVTLGDLRRSRHDIEGAVTEYERAITLGESGDSMLSLAHAHLALGELTLVQGEDERAELHITSALDLYSRVQSDQGWADAQRAWGDLCAARHDLPGAERSYALALDLDDRLTLSRANTHKSRGRTRGASRDYAGALADFSLAIDLYSEARYEVGLAYAHQSRGHVRAALEDYDGADADFARAEEISARLSDTRSLAATYVAHGNLWRVRGQFAEAAACYVGALSLHKDSLDTAALSGTFAELARVRAAQGDPRGALALAEEGEPLARQAGNQLALDLFAAVRAWAAHAIEADDPDPSERQP